MARLMIADPATFASLPLALACLVFLALPPHARGRASCVCRAWRDVLADPALWTRLDMSDVRVEKQRFVAVLRGAAARARGELCHLDISRGFLNRDVLLPVLTANAGSLRDLHVCSSKFTKSAVEAVMAAAPSLQVLTTERVWCTWADAPLLLRAEPPFASVQLRCLDANFADADGFFGRMQRLGPFAAALADAALQPALSEVCVRQADTAQPAVMGSLVDAVLARRLRELCLKECTPPAAAPLTRLLAEGSLVALEIGLSGVPVLFDAAGAALVATALRVNTTLTKLKLRHANLCSDMRVASTLLGALVGHTSLRELWVTHDSATTAKDRIAFGAALAALIAADAPALHVFSCSNNSLGDAGLAPIVEALAHNRHLRELKLGFNDVSKVFARERLLPEVRANTTALILF
jgi:hypothetical protein